MICIFFSLDRLSQLADEAFQMSTPRSQEAQIPIFQVALTCGKAKKSFIPEYCG